jgi:hypothetical protein
MKLKFVRTDDTIETKLVTDENEQSFDYLLFINKLIDGEQIEDIEYPNDVTEDEEKEVNVMIEEINNIINKNTDDEEQ